MYQKLMSGIPWRDEGQKVSVWSTTWNTILFTSYHSFKVFSFSSSLLILFSLEYEYSFPFQSRDSLHILVWFRKRIEDELRMQSKQNPLFFLSPVGIREEGIFQRWISCRERMNRKRRGRNQKTYFATFLIDISACNVKNEILDWHTMIPLVFEMSAAWLFVYHTLIVLLMLLHLLRVKLILWANQYITQREQNCDWNGKQISNVSFFSWSLFHPKWCWHCVFF